MDVKFGKLRPNTNNNFFVKPVINDSDANFFASSSNSDHNNKNQGAQTSGTRMNDFDSNILENNAYQALPDEMFKVEHKMSILEENLSKINNEIKTIEGLGYEIQITDLKNRKQKIEEELVRLNKEYSALGFSTKISSQLTSIVNMASNGKNNSAEKIKSFINKNLLAKISPKISYAQTMKEALSNLSNINSSVDELIQMQVPYGETINRYDKLTAYLNKANIIHSQISKNLNTPNMKNLKP